MNTQSILQETLLLSAQNSWERKYLKIYDETHDELTNLIRHRNVALCFTISVKLPCDSLASLRGYKNVPRDCHAAAVQRLRLSFANIEELVR